MGDPFRSVASRATVPEVIFPVRREAHTAAPLTDDDTVPEGTTKEILAWVGDDIGRAKQALEVQVKRGENGLKGLKRELAKLIEDAEPRNE